MCVCVCAYESLNESGVEVRVGSHRVGTNEKNMGYVYCADCTAEHEQEMEHGAQSSSL